MPPPSWPVSWDGAGFYWAHVYMAVHWKSTEALLAR